MEKKREILKDHFINVNDINITDLEALSYEENKFFFDTENGPLLPKDIVEAYDLENVEYDTLDAFKDVSHEGLLYKLQKSKQITTEIYVWQFGCNTSNNVYWGNSIDQFIDLIEKINAYKVENDYPISNFDIYVHNLAWDIEFFKYWFKDKKFKQIRTSPERKVQKANEKLQNAFDITENNGTVHGARIQLENKTIKKGRKKINYLTTLQFYDSMKITPMSLKKISEKLIKVEDIYIKNSDVYKYNLVRDPKTYVPNEIEAWYIYCDIYLLKEWYNQFLIPMYKDRGVKPYTISQIAFDSVLHETYKGVDRSPYAYEGQDPSKVTDRQIYENHFALHYIEKAKRFKEYFKISYKGGHTTASVKYKELAKTNQATIKGVSCDITSSYPNQMTNKKLPFGKPYYFTGKYKNRELEDGTVLDYHFITIAFDGWVSHNEENQFGLNVKIQGLTDKQKKALKITTNESSPTNWYEGTFVGKNQTDKDKVEDYKRSKLLSKYDNSFIVTIPAKEYEEWEKDFKFYSRVKGQLKEGVLFIDYVSMQSEIGYFKRGLDAFFDMKAQAEAEENEPLRENAKLILNSFYGKHASNRDREQRFYNFDKEIISFHGIDDGEENEFENKWEDKKLYAQYYASAVTSEGRIQLRNTCRAIGQDKFIYADTDSLKFEMTKDQLIDQVKKNKINMSFSKEEKELGWWDFEFEFEDFKAVGQKKYMYKLKGKTDFICKCAGLPKEIRAQIKTKEQFTVGTEFIKKAKRKVIGGNLLLDISYSLNDLLAF